MNEPAIGVEASLLHPIVACPACGKAEARPLYRQPVLDVLQCASCGAAFVLSRVSAQEAERKEARESGEQGARYMREVFIQRQDFWLNHWSERLAPIEALLGRRGKLLDIGCALGHFQLAAERRGWETLGVELSAEQVAYARGTLGLDVRCARFEDLELQPASFDLVCLWSVIEHVPRPLEMLTAVRHLLKADGLLVMQTPNQASLITILAGLGYHLSGGRFLLPVYSLDHILRLDARALNELLARAGFETVSIQQYDNLGVMLARMHLQRGRFLRAVSLAGLHELAALLNRRNQLVAYARPNQHE